MNNWVQIAVLVGTLAMWVIQQIASANREGGAKAAKAPPKNQPQPPRRRQQPAAAPQAEARRQQGERAARAQMNQPGPRAGQARGNELRSEVDEFLRRVNRAAEERADKPRKRPEPEPEQRRRPRVEVLVTDEDIAARRLKPTELDDVDRGRTIGSHVQEHLAHLPESQLAEQAAHLGEDIAQSDERLEAHLAQTFDHKLGRLNQGALRDNQQAAPERAVIASPAAEVLEMIKKPGGMRNAVILNEILTRPKHRWD